ncbi:hypothetical protein SLJ62_05710 [Acinetobacter pittii]|uniref:AbiTii domain-containing protein n=1 Tax=Acinetobacter pittii TaxID=48296 RepID=UPI0013EE9071|nr:hypothetical protein [Acinetobacter pittii]MBN6522663.1 hypothetical protein [Acinetobacter pittii]MDX8155050.1 hypothetical protein [Acinetobacter pittii]
MQINQDSLNEALKLSEEILGNIELSTASLSNCSLKASRLARLLNDFEYQRIFIFESSGYPWNPNGLPKEIWNLCKLANRIIVEKDKEGNDVEKAKLGSIGAIEIELDTMKDSLKVAHDPNISISYANPNQYIAPTNTGNFVERKNLRDSISKNSQFLSQRQAFIYEYVSNKYYELKYSKITADIFSRKRKLVDDKIGDLIPLSAQKFASVYENLNSENTEDWSNAVHSCRRILQDMADIVYPAREDKIIDLGAGRTRSIKLGVDNYINRIIAYVEENSDSERFEDIVGSNIKYLGERLDAIFKAAQKGSHNIIATREEADRYVIYTYLIVGDILDLVETNKILQA